MLIKQEILLGRGTWAKSSWVRESRRTALPCVSQSWVFLTMKGFISRLSLANHSDSESFLVVHTLLSQEMSARRILGGGCEIEARSKPPIKVTTFCFPFHYLVFE